MKTKILGLLAVAMLAGPSGARAVTYVVDGGLLIGANGVSLDGQLYDVEQTLEAIKYLACYCAWCQRWAELDLERLVDEGRGGYRFVGRRPRCAVCGASGQWQLSTPT
jgi:hypothetical protein